MKIVEALAGFENDPKFNLGNYGYTLRRAKGKGAFGFIAYKNERADKAQTPSSEVEELSRWCRKVGGKLENWRKLRIVKHSERRCAAAERSLRHETSYGIDVAQSIFR